MMAGESNGDLLTYNIAKGTIYSVQYLENLTDSREFHNQSGISVGCLPAPLIVRF